MHQLHRYAGQMVLVGQLGTSYEAHGFDLSRCYWLGTLTPGQDLAPAVKAILEDLDDARSVADEVLWVLQVNAGATIVQRAPLVVFDDHERLRYGAEFLTAVAKTGRGAPAVVIRGVRLAEPSG